MQGRGRCSYRQGQGSDAQPLGHDARRLGVTVATRARHFIASRADGAPPRPGGGQKSRHSPRHHRPYSHWQIFSLHRQFGAAGQRLRRRKGRERHAITPGPSPAGTPLHLAALALPARSGRYRGTGFRSWSGAGFRRIIFQCIKPLSGSHVLQGNNGNLGTYHIKQAEILAFEGCQPVPKPSGRFGNMGTDWADPDAGKSARMWLPRLPASRAAGVR